MNDKQMKAIAAAVAFIVNGFILSVIFALSLSASGFLAVLGYIAFTVKLVFASARLYTLLMN